MIVDDVLECEGESVREYEKEGERGSVLETGQEYAIGRLKHTEILKAIAITDSLCWRRLIDRPCWVADG